jgi:UPF0716 family protein affecting phage T7 exclusion
MIKKIIFGIIWFVVIFVLSYSIGGIVYMKAAGVATTGGFQAGLEAGRAFREAYRIYFFIGSLILAVIGTVTGILPGTKRQAPAKKKSSTTKKIRKKG